MDNKIKEALEIIGDTDFQFFYDFILIKQSLPKSIEEPIDYSEAIRKRDAVIESYKIEIAHSPSTEIVYSRIAELIIKDKSSILSIKNGGYFFNMDLLGSIWALSDILRNFEFQEPIKNGRVKPSQTFELLKTALDHENPNDYLFFKSIDAINPLHFWRQIILITASMHTHQGNIKVVNKYSIKVKNEKEEIQKKDTINSINNYAKYFLKNDEGLKKLAEIQKVETEFNVLDNLYKLKNGRNIPYGEHYFKEYKRDASFEETVSGKLKIYKKALIYWKKATLEEDPFVADDPELQNRLIPLLEYEIALLEMDSQPNYDVESAKLVATTNLETSIVVKKVTESITDKLTNEVTSEAKLNVIQHFIKIYKQQIATPQTGFDYESESNKGFVKSAPFQILDWLNIENEYLTNSIGKEVKPKTNRKSKSLDIRLENKVIKELYSELIINNKTDFNDFNTLLKGNPEALNGIKCKIYWNVSNKAIAYLFETFIEKNKCLKELEYPSILESIESYNKNGKILKSTDIRTAKNSYIEKGLPKEASIIDSILS